MIVRRDGASVGCVAVIGQLRPPLFAAALLVLAQSAHASCLQHFASGAPPALLNPKLARQTTELCFDGYAADYSALTRTPFWSAEHLTATAVETARILPRQGWFHSEPSLPEGQSAELGDYVRSGFDRGHMSPNGDMPTESAQQQSFSLANVVPQAPQLNRVLWEGIEIAVRSWALRSGEVFVVTGPVFEGDHLQALHGRVLVPTSIFKAVYDPVRGVAGAYLSPNTDDAGYQAISIAKLTQLTGIDVFPALPESVKIRAVLLPEPTPRYAGRESHESPTAPSPLQGPADYLFRGSQR